MPKFRKKPVVIDAVQFADDSPDTLQRINAILDPVRISYRYPQRPLIIIPQTQRNPFQVTSEARIGDWIIRTEDGTVYSCKPDVFEKTYEQV